MQSIASQTDEKNKSSNLLLSNPLLLNALSLGAPFWRWIEGGLSPAGTRRAKQLWHIFDPEHQLIKVLTTLFKMLKLALKSGSLPTQKSFRLNMYSVSMRITETVSASDLHPLSRQRNWPRI